MSNLPLHRAVCQLRTAHESPWNTSCLRAYIAAVQRQARVLAWQEIVRQSRRSTVARTEITNAEASKSGVRRVGTTGS